MINRRSQLQWVFAAFALLLIGTQAMPAFAGRSADVYGTRKVMKVLKNVSLRNSEQKANESMQDIFDVKSQLYSQKSLLTPLGANTASVTSRPRTPASRYRMPYQR
jgi:hypothetical protein